MKQNHVCARVLLLAGLISASTGVGQEVYEGGRGLLTLEGPSGLFINPSSGTLTKDAATLQYCVLFPNNKTDVVAHGLMGAYGVADNLEVGARGLLVDPDAGDTLAGGGPLVRYRIMQNDGVLPELSVGGYSHFGDDELDKYAAFVAAFERFPIDEQGVLRSVGIHAGAKNLWVDDKFNPDDTSLTAYGGLEVELPLRIYAVGEVQTKDDDFHAHTPYAFGLQWRASGIAMSAAGIQDGTFDDPSFFYGIGYAAAF